MYLYMLYTTPGIKCSHEMQFLPEEGNNTNQFH